MIKLITIFIFFFVTYSLKAVDHQMDGETESSDTNYYKSGVSFYENGDFDKSFIVFFNLAEKGDKDSIFNLSNMYFEGIGTIQDYSQALKYTWLCSLNGNKKCLQKINLIEEKLEENEFINISKEIPEILENEFVNENNYISAFKLGYWYEKVSPEIDFEKSYLWYSISVSAGIYKAMKIRDRVGGLIEKNKITEIQQEAKDIFTKNKYFNVKKEN